LIFLLFCIYQGFKSWRKMSFIGATAGWSFWERWASDASWCFGGSLRSEFHHNKLFIIS